MPPYRIPSLLRLRFAAAALCCQQRRPRLPGTSPTRRPCFPRLTARKSPMATASSSPSTPQPFKVRPHRFQSDNNPFPLPPLVLTAGGFVASQLILGSSSVARKHILEEMGLEFQVMTADIDEKSIRRENPDDLVMVLAEAKADAIMSRLNIADYQKEGSQPTLLITSDIVVVHEGIIREKPTTKEEARQFLKGYSGGHVSTVGSVVVTNLTTGKRLGSLDKAEVYFHDIPDEVIENLIDEGVVFRVAGGLLLEHPLTLPFVEAVVGSSDSVMGLSKEIANKLIHDALPA
ncbi:hypothetical protein C2845_PM09G07410 [Panicum miliaceum]|uniref:Maf-like protein n=1 Tax=Panicum miliaceum TaxID=4540 RepID=A0A3L6RYW0_PANMI|nr:hypothetical protein C2845_PM09G07410 [Panicum miliaceum]